MTVPEEFDTELTACSAAVEYITFQVLHELKHKCFTAFYVQVITRLCSGFSASSTHLFWSVLDENGSQRLLLSVRQRPSQRPRAHLWRSSCSVVTVKSILSAVTVIQHRDERPEARQHRPEHDDQQRGHPEQPAELRGRPVRRVHVDGARGGVQQAGEEQLPHLLMLGLKGSSTPNSSQQREKQGQILTQNPQIKQQKKHRQS